MTQSYVQTTDGVYLTQLKADRLTAWGPEVSGFADFWKCVTTELT